LVNYLVNKAISLRKQIASSYLYYICGVELPLKLIVVHLVITLPIFYGTEVFNYRVHKIPPMYPNLSRINPVHVFIQCFFEMNFNIILPPTPRSNFLYISGRVPCMALPFQQKYCGQLWASLTAVR